MGWHSLPKSILQKSMTRGQRGYDWAWSKVIPPTLILTYHRVASPDLDPHEICVSPENFSAHLEVLQKNSLVSSWEDFGDFSRPRVFITFDDGYRDNLEAAAPLLQKWNCEGLFFIASRLIRDGGLFWWDELALRVLHPEVSRPSALVLRTNEKETVFSLKDASARKDSHNRLHRFLKRDCNFSRRAESLEQIRKATGPLPRKLLDAHALLAPDQVIDLSRFPGCRIGAHTLNHPCLRFVSAVEQEKEISESRRDLEKMLQSKIDFFSYPFGSYLDFDRRSRQIAKKTGYRYAFANIPGTVKPGFPKYAINRFTVRNWNVERFRKEFSDLLPVLG